MAVTEEGARLLQPSIGSPIVVVVGTQIENRSSARDDTVLHLSSIFTAHPQQSHIIKDSRYIRYTYNRDFLFQFIKILSFFFLPCFGHFDWISRIQALLTMTMIILTITI